MILSSIKPKITMPNLLDRISIDPQMCGGKPCIKGTRIWVSLVLDLLAGGCSEASCSPNIRNWCTTTFWPPSPTAPRPRASGSFRSRWSRPREAQGRSRRANKRSALRHLISYKSTNRGLASKRRNKAIAPYGPRICNQQEPLLWQSKPDQQKQRRKNRQEIH
jgi:hypothetical protein